MPLPDAALVWAGTGTRIPGGKGGQHHSLQPYPLSLTPRRQDLSDPPHHHPRVTALHDADLMHPEEARMSVCPRD
ncbi:hypothetical protein ACOMHN_014535 [Nucella lapillus]